jgi:Right handed beta helix region/Chlamydia polymorphic membrane protein (Chlamydia_PMP) repeat
MRKSVLRCSGVGLALLLPCLTLASRTLACVVGTGTGASCTEAALNACLPGGGSFGGTVTFNCGGAATITVTSTKFISADTTIDGGSLITISGGNSVGIFSNIVFSKVVNFTVRNLTIANGKRGGVAGAILNGGRLTVTNSIFSDNSAGVDSEGIAGSGGAIVNDGTLTVTNSTFSDNSASFGGAIANSGTLAVTNSTFSGNSAIDSGTGDGLEGGAILNGASSTGPSGTLTVTNSIFSGNSASFGGAIANDADSVGPLTVTNSTFSGNSGGAIYVGGDGPLMVTNSTFSGNGGGGIYNDGGPLTVVTNSIVANSTAGGNCAGSITDGGHNIDDDGSCGLSGTSLSNTNPMLDPGGLANNGGPTQTIALLAGSPAINAGDESACAAPPVNNLDQRGYVRPGAGATSCSIGAYEYNAVPASSVTCAGDCDGGGSVTVNEIITLVNIALGSADASACPHGVPSGGSVDVALIIQAV